MEQNKLKMFISYSHDNKEYLKDFLKHIFPLENNGLIECWYDEKVKPGEIFQDKIDISLENADIVCLLISAESLSSVSCIKERETAIELKRKKGIAVIPIILTDCGWLDCKEISSLLALPTDGKPILSFSSTDKAWKDVYDGVKTIIEKYIKLRSLKNTEQFSHFLNDAEALTKASSGKETVTLDDIFIYPELMKIDDVGEYERKTSSQDLIESLPDHQKIVIAGENQSGKTTLCKRIYSSLRKKGFVPIYISGNHDNYKGLMRNKISDAFVQQYENALIDKIDENRIVPILDDFHLAANKEKHVRHLSSYSCCILIVDDIFNLNLRDEHILRSFFQVRIREFSPSLRNELIEKWITLTDKKTLDHSGNRIYKQLDGMSELVDSSLGKVLGDGIMPAYPFFILSIMTIHQSFRPLEEITSQGYCYQALIYIYLRKVGVENDEIDTYINFLTEFSFFFFDSGKSEISEADLDLFMESYLDKYNFPVKLKTLLQKLEQTGMIALDNFGHYSFRYQYLYYFFVSKYLAEHIDENREIITKIMRNLHKDENAHIAVFISHHSKNTFVLDEVTTNAKSLFGKYAPTTLNKEELGFFNKQADTIIEAALLPKSSAPAKERTDRLKIQDKIEESKKQPAQKDEDYDDIIENHDNIDVEFRRSIKTVEVMGGIIKNRAGSLEKQSLESIFEEGVEIYLRILTSFFDGAKDDELNELIIDFILYILYRITQDKKDKPTREKLKKMSETIFWNIIFIFTYGLIHKVIRSVGSNKLSRIIDKVCDEKNTPAYFLIKHGISMWYSKTLQIDDIAERIGKDDFSEITRKMIRFMIVDHVSMHKFSFKEKQRIEKKFGIPSRRLLISQKENRRKTQKIRGET
uniref:TIR domain-containing protein n=1 Tax=Candidatus Kentrum sp. TC TaxID=2126339 RepID=A0A451A3I3_9GAMM|nr:MAG: TIR domain-containing protein [Candidatus Kentron sp. TC]